VTRVVVTTDATIL